MEPKEDEPINPSRLIPVANLLLPLVLAPPLSGAKAIRSVIPEFQSFHRGFFDRGIRLRFGTWLEDHRFKNFFGFETSIDDENHFANDLDDALPGEAFDAAIAYTDSWGFTNIRLIEMFLGFPRFPTRLWRRKTAAAARLEGILSAHGIHIEIRVAYSLVFPRHNTIVSEPWSDSLKCLSNERFFLPFPLEPILEAAARSNSPWLKNWGKWLKERLL